MAGDGVTGSAGRPCLGEAAIFDFLAGDLDDEAVEAVEIHIDECSDCRGLLAEAARRETRGASSLGTGPTLLDADGTGPTMLDTGDPIPAASMAYPDAGTVIDRYTVDRFLGAGGMGVVLLASDPELDRKVTLKLLRPELADPDDTRGARARLLREAQAMARLSHPNVVPIYDIGTWNDQVFIAMEYLDGGNLATWLERERDPSEVIEIFCAAGRGLAAAHAAGLVHRDFKPTNVMLSTDGSVKVTDFGLALPGGEHRPTGQRAAVSPDLGGSSLTRTGAIVGTPAYMAPEQMRGELVDPRSDLFSFCVALHEGLYGSRPFSGASTTELLEATVERRLEPPDRTPRLPERIRAAVAAGIEADPDARPASMSALLEALAPRRTGRWRLVAVAAAGLAGAALIAAGIGWNRAADQPLELVAATCSHGGERIAPSWSPAIAGEIDRALSATGARTADLMAGKIRGHLDRYRDQWVAVHRAACTATHLRGEQRVELYESQMACLERRRAELDRAVAGLRLVSAETVGTAEQLATNLTSPMVCSSAERMKREPPQPADAETARKVAAVRLAISGGFAAASSGKLESAIERLATAVESAREIGFAPVEAEAWLAKGRAEAMASRYDAAVDSLREAIQVAQLGRHDRVRADAYIDIIDLQIARSEFDEAGRWLRYARDALAQVAVDAEAEAKLLDRGAALHRHRGDISRAIADSERALELRRQLYGERDPAIADALVQLAATRANGANDHAGALPLYREALAMLADLYGERDLRLVPVMTGLAASLSAAGHHDQALAMLDREAAILAEAYGESNPLISSLEATRAYYLDRAGRHDEAIALIGRSIAAAREVFGEGSQQHIDALVLRGGLHFTADDYELAHADLALGVAMADKLYGPGGQSTLISRNLLGTNLTGAGRLREARSELERNAAAARGSLSETAPLYADILARLAKAERLDGLAARAIARLEKALGILGDSGDPSIVAFARWQLAQALGPGDRSDALAGQARVFYASSRGDPDTVAEIDRWLER